MIILAALATLAFLFIIFAPLIFGFEAVDVVIYYDIACTVSFVIMVFFDLLPYFIWKQESNQRRHLEIMKRDSVIPALRTFSHNKKVSLTNKKIYPKTKREL